jgi:NADH-quinone oxidoreductase subunit A
MLLEYASVGVFMAVAFGFVAFALVLSRLLRPHKPNPEKEATYECGLEPVGSGWLQFNIRFYVVALVFLVFEIEAVFMFPWAVVYDRLGLFGLVEMTVFIGILLVGLAYVWGKGDLEWVKTVMGGRGAERALPAPDMTPNLGGRAVPTRGAGTKAAYRGAASEAGAGRTGGKTGGD